MFSSVVVKSVCAIKKQLHYLKLISKIYRYKFFSIVATCAPAISRIPETHVATTPQII